MTDSIPDASGLQVVGGPAGPFSALTPQPHVIERRKRRPARCAILSEPGDEQEVPSVPAGAASSLPAGDETDTEPADAEPDARTEPASDEPRTQTGPGAQRAESINLKRKSERYSEYPFVKDYLRAMKHVRTRGQLKVATALLRRDVGFLILGGKARYSLRRTVTTEVFVGGKPVHVKCVEVEFVDKAAAAELLQPHKYVRQTNGDDNNAETKAVNFIKRYMEGPTRTEYDRAKFLPGMLDTGRTLNLWTGWPVAPAPGDCSLFLAHLRDNICSGNVAHYTFVLDWLAHIFQHPMMKPGSALVFRGEKGVGKTKVAEWLLYLLAHYSMRFTKTGLLTGRFNSHQENKLLFVADEGYYAGDPSAVGTLNSLITDTEETYEAKGIDARKGQSFCRVIVIGNKE